MSALPASVEKRKIGQIFIVMESAIQEIRNFIYFVGFNFFLRKRIKLFSENLLKSTTKRKKVFKNPPQGKNPTTTKTTPPPKHVLIQT